MSLSIGTLCAWAISAEKQKAKLIVYYDKFRKEFFPYFLLKWENEEEIIRRINGGMGNVMKDIMNIKLSF